MPTDHISRSVEVLGRAAGATIALREHIAASPSRPNLHIVHPAFRETNSNVNGPIRFAAPGPPRTAAAPCWHLGRGCDAHDSVRCARFLALTGDGGQGRVGHRGLRPVRRTGRADRAVLDGARPTGEDRPQATSSAIRGDSHALPAVAGIRGPALANRMPCNETTQFSRRIGKCCTASAVTRSKSYV